jgi:hypothetical protein
LGGSLVGSSIGRVLGSQLSRDVRPLAPPPYQRGAPPDIAKKAVDSGWAEVHPVARARLARENIGMIYDPRDDHEVDVVFSLVLAAYLYAGGKVTKT